MSRSFKSRKCERCKAEVFEKVGKGKELEERKVRCLNCWEEAEADMNLRMKEMEKEVDKKEEAGGDGCDSCEGNKATIVELEGKVRNMQEEMKEREVKEVSDGGSCESCEEMKEKIDELKKKDGSERDVRVELEDKVRSMQEELKEVKEGSNCGSCEEMKKKIAETEVKEGKERELGEIEKEIVEKRKVRGKLVKDIGGLTDISSRLETIVKGKEASLIEEGGECEECDALRNKVKEMEKGDAMRKEKGGCDQEVAQLVRKVRELENEVKAKDTRMEELEKNGMEGNSRGGCDQEVAQLIQKIRKLEKEIKVQDSMVKEISDLKVEKARMKSTMEDYLDKLAVKEDSVDRMLTDIKL